MNYLSVCSGIEAATVAWHSLGWKAVGYSEIEAFPSGVLKHHYPDVTNFGDMTKYKEWKIERTVELLVGGTPCQSFSVAGLRKGLADPRGNLALTYCGILDHFRPKWFVWENVPGVLSSNGGRDFGSFLGALVELGYGFAYRVLDAQYFGVAQRRRRVFVVGYLGDWRPAAEVLFEPESLRGDSPPSRGKGQEIANCFTSSPSQHRSPNEDATLIPSYALQGAGHTSQNTNGQGWSRDISYTLNTTDVHGVAHPVGVTLHGSDGAARVASFSDLSQCLRSRTPGNIENSSTTVVAHPMAFTQNTRDEVRWINGDGQIAGALAAEAGMKQTNYIAQSLNIYGGNKRPDRPDGGFYVRMNEETSKTLDSSSGLNPTAAQGGTAVIQPIAFSSNMSVPDCTTDGVSPTLKLGGQSGGNPPAVAFTCSEQANSYALERPFAPTITAKQPSDSSNMQTGVRIGMAVRRLTPVECERLQGFPDNYTNIPWRKQPESPDGPRYKALGNSMAVPVMAWIGQRIANYEQQA